MDNSSNLSVLTMLLIAILLTSISADLYARPDFKARVLNSGYHSIQHRLYRWNTITDSIYIDNSGDEDLEWELELVAEGDWIEIDRTEGTVEPRGRNWVVVEQRGRNIDEDFVEADLDFTSNDPTREEYTIPVIGWTINYPRIEVGWPDGWGEWWGMDMNSFIDNLEWGHEYEFEITIRNRWGGARLEVEDLPCNNGYFEFEPTEFNVDHNRAIQVTVTFSADEVGYHTATIASESNAWDPQEIDFRIVGEVFPVFRIINPIPDIDMQEDAEERIIADLDTVFLSSSRGIDYRVISADEMRTRIERNGSFFLMPSNNFFGVSDVIVSASSQDSTLVDTFCVFVNPLPDPPDPFDLIAPSDSAVIHPTESDSLFIWQASSDPDGDTLLYDLSITNTDNRNSITFDDLRDTTFATSMLSEIMNIEAGGLFTWFVTARDSSFERVSQSIFTNRLAPASVNERFIVPESIDFAEVYPNPFNTSLSVHVQLEKNSHLAVKVFDLKGRFLSEIFNGSCSIGSHIYSWDTKSVASGKYMIKIESSEQQAILPVVLSK